MSKTGESSGGVPPTGTGWTDNAPSKPELEALVSKIGDQQRRVAASTNAHLDGQMDRGQHQKQLFGAFGTLRIFEGLPSALTFGLFAKAATYRVACRFSNGQPCPFADHMADLRGVAIKLFTADGIETDLLMTNEGGRSHARNAAQFVDFADVLVAQIERGMLGLAFELTSEVVSGKLGLLETGRMLQILSGATLRHVNSLAAEHYWGSVVKLGTAAIEYSLHPDAQTEPGTKANASADDYLGEDLRNRLSQGSVKWQLSAQLFVDEQSTPVNDASVAWDAPLVVVGELEISAAPSADDETSIGRMAFNPAHGFEPLGITRAREVVYAASAKNREARGLLTSEQARRMLQSF
jgi:hypothetical protein